MKRFALLGEKLSHSFSPIIHNKLFELRKLNYKYELLECKKEELKEVLNYLKKDTYSGYNVTIPYKQEVMKYLDEISEEAKIIGSVNTIKVENNKLIGYNTDYYGFIEELNFYKIDVNNKKCFILGTGGASLAIKKALIDLGADISFVSRKSGDNLIKYEELIINKNDIIINTTPVGMYPNIDDSPINSDTAKNALAIVDLIFNPLETKLMSYNKNSYNGLIMLIAQANKAQEIWFNSDKKIDLNEMLNYVIEVI